MPLEAETEQLSHAAQDVFETMFFVAVDETPEPAEWSSRFAGARLVFEGAQHGQFELHLDRALAKEIAAAFTGVEHAAGLPPDSIPEVVCELASLVCGASLSRMYPEALFDLRTPQFFEDESGPTLTGQLVQWLDSGQGLIRLALAWD